tara:strand:+ start:80 stop:871 length:792 start_codon:yes stop_codon:yes gene_type:complete
MANPTQKIISANDIRNGIALSHVTKKGETKTLTPTIIDSGTGLDLDSRFDNPRFYRGDSNGLQTTATYTIAASADDGYWRKGDEDATGTSESSPTSYNSIQTASSLMFAGGNYDDEDVQYDWYKSYFRFNNVAIAQGATIASAYIKPYFSAAYGTPTLRIVGYDSDDALQPSSSIEGGHAQHTTAYVEWANPSGSNGDQLTSPDIKTVIQEIVDRAGWTSGSDLMIMMFVQTISRGGSWPDAYIRWHSYDNSVSQAAQLEITV